MKEIRGFLKYVIPSILSFALSGVYAILTFMEPVSMLVLMLILPPLFGGQIMIWWSIVIARILSACLALIFNSFVDKQKLAM